MAIMARGKFQGEPQDRKQNKGENDKDQLVFENKHSKEVDNQKQEKRVLIKRPGRDRRRSLLQKEANQCHQSRNPRSNTKKKGWEKEN